MSPGSGPSPRLSRWCPGPGVRCWGRADASVRAAVSSIYSIYYLLHGRYLHYLHYLHSTPALVHTLGTHSNLGLLSRQPASIPPPAVTITQNAEHSDRDDVKIGILTVRVVVTKGENQEEGSDLFYPQCDKNGEGRMFTVYPSCDPFIVEC